jgi:2-methylisocitrate lyase-like PEP mutase family enzyme
MERPGPRLREAFTHDIVPLIGVYDAFSASIAARQFPGLFVSGFGFAASFYGLPDIGFIAWSDMTAYVQRLRTLLPTTHLVVDIDDGYCDVDVACHVTSLLEGIGASAVVLEDQQRPRKCGHLEGKRIMPLPEYIEKLKAVLATRHDMVVVARTDAQDPDDIVRRVRAFSEAGADVILVEAVRDLAMFRELRSQIACPLAFNQIAGGKSPRCSLSQLRDVGVRLVNYSTPCLFAAQTAIGEVVSQLARDDGMLPEGGVGVRDCNALLDENLAGRDR